MNSLVANDAIPGHAGHVTHGGLTDPTAPDVLGRFRAHHFMIGQCSHEKVAQNGMGTRLLIHHDLGNDMLDIGAQKTILAAGLGVES